MILIDQKNSTTLCKREKALFIIFLYPRYLNIFNIYQLLHIDNAPMGELERLEMVIESTYEKSFREVGEYEKYAKIISELGIGEKKVYQVTPKGNVLIAIVEKTGSKKLKENHQKDVFGDFIPKPAFAY